MIRAKGEPSTNRYRGEEAILIEGAGLEPEPRASEEDAVSTPPPDLGYEYALCTQPLFYYKQNKKQRPISIIGEQTWIGSDSSVLTRFNYTGGASEHSSVKRAHSTF